MFLFYLSSNVSQGDVTFSTALPGFNSISQRRHLIFLPFEQPQG